VDNDRHEQFGELFVRNQNRIYRYILTLVGNHADAEELFQQTNLTLWKTWDRYDAEREFVPWACGIAHNHVRNFVRKKENQQVLLSHELLQQLGERRMEHDEVLERRKEALATCMEKLTDQQKQLVERCYSGEESIKTTAEELGKTPNALYKTLRRIRAVLHDCISKVTGAGKPSSATE